MRKHGCLNQFSSPFIVSETANSCSKLNRCNPCPNFLLTSPTLAGVKADAIGCPRFWPLPSGATLCGMRGYQAIADWAQALSQKARQRFGCRYRNGRYLVPSLTIIRDVLIRVDPAHLDRAFERWNQAYAEQDQSLAIDGKTMCNAIDDQGHRPTYHERGRASKQHLLHPKKVGALPIEGSDELKRTNEIKTAIPLLDAIDIHDKTITADALLTQREIANYLVHERKAHYHFTVKNNQPGLFQDIALYFEHRGQPDFVTLRSARPRPD